MRNEKAGRARSLTHPAAHGTLSFAMAASAPRLKRGKQSTLFRCKFKTSLFFFSRRVRLAGAPRSSTTTIHPPTPPFTPLPPLQRCLWPRARNFLARESSFLSSSALFLFERSSVAFSTTRCRRHRRCQRWRWRWRSEAFIKYSVYTKEEYRLRPAGPKNAKTAKGAAWGGGEGKERSFNCKCSSSPRFFYSRRWRARRLLDSQNLSASSGRGGGGEPGGICIKAIFPASARAREFLSFLARNQNQNLIWRCARSD